MPTAAPVTASLIVKNEPLLRDTLSKLRPYVAEIVVVDTGSDFPPSDLVTEGLIDRLEIRPGEFDYHGIPIDFSAARNRSLGLATQPWMLWLDGDDTIDGLESLHELIADADSHRLAGPPGTQVQVMLPYEYSYDAGGRCELVLHRERLHSKPSAWVWQYPVHEVISPAPGVIPLRLERTCMVWKHRRTQAGKTGEGTVKRNVAIVQKYLEVTPEEKIDYRMAFYSAISFAQANCPEDAEKWFEKSMHLSNMDFDKVMTMMQLTQLLIATKKLDKALSAASFVLQTYEDWPYGYFQSAKIWYMKALEEPKDEHRWRRVVHFAKLGLALPEVKTIWFVDPRERHEIQIYLCVAYDHLSRYAEGLAAAEEGLKGFPGDAALEFNRDLFASVVGQGHVLSKLRELAALRGKHGAVDKILNQTADAIVGVLPRRDLEPPKVEVVDLEPMREDGKLRIVIACGDGWEIWNPDVLMKGKGFGGGSEIAVIEMSKRLAARGHDVTVFASCGAERDYDGVHWKNTSRMYGNVACDVLLAWRIAEWLNLPIRARVKALWLHDIIAHNANRENLAKADRVMVLSRFHGEEVLRNHAEAHGLKHSQIALTRTGVGNMDRFRLTDGRVPMRVIYNSSPDRGLGALLRMWLKIRAAVPEATLDIFYGFEMWRKMGHNQAQADELERQIRLLKEDGVTMRGRVTADELAAEMCHAGAWLYPNQVFPEIACVAAMEAMLAGLHVVTSTGGALPETVGDGGVLVGPSFFEDEFLKAAIAALRIDSSLVGLERRRLVSEQARKRFDLDTLVVEWEQMFNDWILEKEVPAFEGVM